MEAAAQINISAEAVFAELQEMVAQQALDLAAERAAKKVLRRQIAELTEMLEQLGAKLPEERTEGGEDEQKGEGADQASGRGQKGRRRQAD